MSQQPPDWETLERSPVRWSRVFGVQDVKRRSPRTGRSGLYQVIHCAPWCNVVALTPDDELVLIYQYRHGVDALCLEIPGGLVDPGERPEDAATRELLEETGYTGDAPVLLGEVHPNPALQNNRCSTYLVTNARLTHAPNLDEGEDIRVTRVPISAVPELITQGEITHALVIAALWHLLAKTGKALPGRSAID